MTIHMPDNLESSIIEVVESGRFASVDDAMAEAARLLLRQVEEKAADSARAEPLDDTSPEDQPIWEAIEELRRHVPPEEFLKLPKDGAAQIDHYIYGSPKRPAQ